ncbi:MULTISPECIES: HlyD family efflux transporter periplasmic adaptor subunit [unclassified Sphingobacterium]|uniref:HlyD family efflux transporter periplasmic adaptor subunit n=1 Tax=unclassified Sphingobacterium TaxID=2609468 RepID=UPI00143C87FA|nr:HlyD family efflux transporter periplasmic adaptor subunit [Sphingobacterium sp. B16(2022)]NJI75745.1 HlyD family efflux transporter periplasmic adaptor subunit [Sphingobacterium sp. B16(2022)]
MATKDNILDNINLRSEQVQEVLETPPNWLIRWGSLVMLGIILLFFLLACIIKYPEFISSTIIISSQNPPEKIEVRIDSRIEKLIAKDQKTVKKGDLLMVLESSADDQDIYQLKKILDSLSTKQLSKFPLQLVSSFRLGEVQEDYNAFAKALEEEILFTNLQPYAAEEVTALKGITDYKERVANLRQQHILESSKLQLTEKNYKRSESLHREGVIAALELENEKVKLLEAQRNFKNTEISIAQLEETILNFKKIKSGADVNIVKEKTSYSSASILLLEKLKKALRQWEKTYLVYASIDGTLSYLQFLGEKQFVKAGSTLLSILPNNRQITIGQMHIGAQNQGKIKINQKVLIKLDNYKYQEYGIVQGKIKSIALVQDKDSKYYIEVALPNGLQTSYHKTIVFDKELSGTADIVTQELTLAERILSQLRSLLRYQDN